MGEPGNRWAAATSGSVASMLRIGVPGADSPVTCSSSGRSLRESLWRDECFGLVRAYVYAELVLASPQSFEGPREESSEIRPKTRRLGGNKNFPLFFCLHKVHTSDFSHKLHRVLRSCSMRNGDQNSGIGNYLALKLFSMHCPASDLRLGW